MAYTPTTWVDKVTKLGPTNLNHLEAGVQATAVVADAALPTPGGSDGQFLRRTSGLWAPANLVAADLPIGQKYTPGVMRQATALGGFNGFQDATSSQASWLFVVPTDYTSGTGTIHCLSRANVTGSQINLTRSVYRFRNGAAFATLDNAVAWNYTPADVNSNLRDLTGYTIQAGDILRLDVTRDGAGDANNGFLDIDHAYLEYTGRL